MALVEPFSIEVWLTLIPTISTSLFMILLIGFKHPHVEESLRNSLLIYYVATVFDQPYINILKLKSMSLRFKSVKT